MYTKKFFSTKDLLLWTGFETFVFFGIASTEVIFFVATGSVFLIPFAPIALIGTAVAFVIGFQNGSAYNRIWEARMIWGSIVNASRALGILVQDFINNDRTKQSVSDEVVNYEKKIIIYRHIAWLTALRYAMRQPRSWEYVMKENSNKGWAKSIYVPEFNTSFQDAINPYLSEDELAYIENKSNKQTAILYLQSRHLRRLKEEGLIWEFSFLRLENIVKELLDHQGKSERIKNFPYPRQFASILYYFTWIFILMVPISIAGQFHDLGLKINNELVGADQWFVWLSIPFTLVVMWVYYTMYRIGRVGENPFEGTANDVPISTIARSIEIDLRQNLGEDPAEIPQPFEMKRDTQM